MNNKIKLSLGISTLMLAILSCNMPTGSAVKSPELEQTPLQAPITAQEADTPDYSSARLTASDLPAGFRELTEQELMDLGISGSQFTNAFSGMLSQASPQNFAAFTNTNGSFEVVVSALMVPLTTLEGAAVDLYLADPQRLANDFSSASGATNLSIDSTAPSMGNSSSSATFVLPTAALEMNGGVTVSRRGQVLQVALLFYPAGTTPTLTSSTVAEIVDAKLSNLD